MSPLANGGRPWKREENGINEEECGVLIFWKNLDILEEDILRIWWKEKGKKKEKGKRKKNL